jgi:hypothetical protein
MPVAVGLPARHLQNCLGCGVLVPEGQIFDLRYEDDCYQSESEWMKAMRWLAKDKKTA